MIVYYSVIKINALSRYVKLENRFQRKLLNEINHDIKICAKILMNKICKSTEKFSSACKHYTLIDVFSHKSDNSDTTECRYWVKSLDKWVPCGMNQAP